MREMVSLMWEWESEDLRKRDHEYRKLQPNGLAALDFPDICWFTCFITAFGISQDLDLDGLTFSSKMLGLREGT